MSRRFQFSLKTLFWSMVAVGCLSALAVRLRPGIKVVVANAGQSPVQYVTLHVTGNSYLLGDIAPGEAKGTAVRPTGESGLEIEFADETGNRLRLSAGDYFEPGYRGTISISIKDGVICNNDHQISLY